MRTKNNEAIKTLMNAKKGTPKGHLAQVSPFPGTHESARKTTRAAKTDMAYWKKRVRPRVLKDGTITPELYLRLKEGGRDAWLFLATANRSVAACKARDLWQAVQVKGLDAVLAEQRPAKRPERVCTVAEYIKAAKTLATVRARTLAEYEASFRRVVAGVRGIVAKSDKHPDRADWHHRIESVRLDQITPSSVRAWMKAELDAASIKGEDVKDRREHTLASHLRDARSLFSTRILGEIKKSLTLPEELPFDGITASATTRRFVSNVEPRKLYTAARSLDADTRLAFDLLLCGGLRRGEADTLPWAHVDMKAGTVRIDITEHFRPKSRESFRTVPLPADLLKRMKACRKANPEAVFVLEGKQPKPATGRGYEYRANAWPILIEWLRKKGLNELTPLHDLRKMSGSFVYANAGLEAARRHLGHRDITTTARSYLQTRSAVVDFTTKA